MLAPAQSLVIAERYALVRELARGGMGSVWLAQDQKLRRQVAIKLMMPLWAESGDARSRFEREAMAVAQLKSPHIVQVFDYGIQDGCPYIVMELLEGEDLRSRLQRDKRLEMEAAGVILVQTAKALGVAHAVGIVHRDLKPGNVFIARSRDDEIVKVIDFGVVKADPNSDMVREATRTGSVLGTPQFMSPEQARALPDIDHRSDLWSLGIILYRSLTGELPYNGKSATDVIVKICTESFVPASKLVPELPEELDRFFDKALAREPADRFSSAREMAVAFMQLSSATLPGPMSMPGAMPGARTSYPSLPAFTPSGLFAAAAPPDAAALAGPAPSGEENPTTLRSGKIAPVRISHSQATLATASVSTTTPAVDERPRGRRSLWLGLGGAALVAAGVAVAIVAGGGRTPAPTAGVATGVEQAAAVAANPRGDTVQEPGAAAQGTSMPAPVATGATASSEAPPATASAEAAASAKRTAAPVQPGVTAVRPPTTGKATAAATTATAPATTKTNGDPFNERL
ncbi:MAG: serine/threonine protein kinase [Polyangiaceae bacterium]|nr:serine/threonine protein kinase [Polyangiaceae bacterium]